MTTPQNNKKDKTPTTLDTLINEPTPPALTLDVDYYQSFLDDTDIPEHKKREFIEALWSIVTAFIDLGFGVHPIQQATGQCASNDMAEIITTFIGEFEESKTTNKSIERTDT